MYIQSCVKPYIAIFAILSGVVVKRLDSWEVYNIIEK